MLLHGSCCFYPLLLINILVHQWCDSLYSDGKHGKYERATSVCPLLTGVTTAMTFVEPHPTVMQSHILYVHTDTQNGAGWMSVFFTTFKAQHSSVCEFVWALSVCVRERESWSRNLSWQCVCVGQRERGPLVLSDRGIRSEGMYLSLSDSTRLFSPPAQLLTLLDNIHWRAPDREERLWPWPLNNEALNFCICHTE